MDTRAHAPNNCGRIAHSYIELERGSGTSRGRPNSPILLVVSRLCSMRKMSLDAQRNTKEEETKDDYGEHIYLYIVCVYVYVFKQVCDEEILERKV